MPVDAKMKQETTAGLGRIVATYPTAAAFVQRAAVVALVSFVFFLLMLVGFAIRQHFGYFLLATAFLVVYLFTMFGWWVQRRVVVTIHENGIAYRKFAAVWRDVAEVNEMTDAKGSTTLTLTDQSGRSVAIPPTIDRIEQVAQIVRANVAR